MIGPNNVAVPTHFFKVIVGETENNEFDLESYVMQNTAIDDNVPIKAFLVSFIKTFLINLLQHLNGKKYSKQYVPCLFSGSEGYY